MANVRVTAGPSNDEILFLQKKEHRSKKLFKKKMKIGRAHV